MRRTSRDYAHPHRPLPIRWFDRVGRPRASLEPASLMAAARRAEGLNDFGDPDVEPLLERLCAALEDEARLTPMGRWIQRIRMVDGLRVRLRLQARWDREPELLHAELLPPVVIIGLQRTGTTLLHRLLASAPGARALASWEALNPVAYRSGSNPDGRIRHAKVAARALRWMAPDFFAVHPIDPMAPEEEVVLMDHSLLSTVPEATLRLPSWSAWLEEQDQTPAYRFLRRALLTLQADRPGTHWVLKTPHHLEWLDTLLAVFPEVRVVMTHRDPLQTQGSFCSMVAHGYGLCSDAVDPHEIGQTWLRKCVRLLTRALESRDRAEVALCDVRYEALLADPLAEVERVHRFAGLPWSERESRAVQAQLDASPRHRYGVHDYALSDFGLTETRVAAAYADYRARFGFSDAPKR